MAKPHTADTPPHLLSLGYQGRSLADIVTDLQRAGAQALVDVRLTPLSRKPGFSRGALSTGLAEAGITYVHEPDLGNPRENRAAFVKGDPAAWDWLRQRLEGAEGQAALRRLVERARVAPVGVLCFEQSAEQCHRSLVIELARELEPALIVTGLPPSQGSADR